MIRFLLDNIGWKIFSLAVAVVLWMTFVSSPELVTSITVPVAYARVPRDLDLITTGTDRVHLEIQGPSSRLQNYDLGRIMVVIDASQVHGAGERDFDIQQDEVILPTGLKLLRAEPPQVRVRFERRVRKQVNVRVPKASPPPPGYEVRREEIHPARLTIVGPESAVSAIQAIETTPVDLSKYVAESEFRVHALQPDPQVHFDSSPQVRVRVWIARGKK